MIINQLNEATELLNRMIEQGMAPRIVAAQRRRVQRLSERFADSSRGW